MDVWKWIEGGPGDGATQMATDRAVLENAIEFGKPTMRVYRWEPHCISLGYHQSLENIDLDRCLEDGIDVVRRPTGGRAVFHTEEVTYSVVIPEGSDYYSQSIAEVYNLISRGLVRGILNLGVPAELQRRSLDYHSHYRTALSMNCFSAASRNEIIVDGKKLVGSAQRRLSCGVLQHGSILTGNAHLDLPEYLKGVGPGEKRHMRKMIEERTVSINGYLGEEVDYGDVVAAIRDGMEQEISIRFEEGELTFLERERARFLRRNFSVFSGRMIPLPEDTSDC